MVGLGTGIFHPWLSMSARAAAMAACGAFLLVGCSEIPKDGPSGFEVRGSAEVAVQDGGRLSYAVVKLSPLVLAAIQTERPAPISFSGLSRAKTAPSIRVGPSDTVSVTIFEAGAGGLFSPGEAAAGSRAGNSVQIPPQEIDRNGYINVPYGGLIRALGRTPREIENDIVEAIKNRAIEPQVIVSVGERTSNGVSVLGHVNTPKLIPLKPGGIRLLAAIAEAGGSKFEPHDTVIHLQRRGKNEQALLSSILLDPSQNLQLEPNDVVYALAQPRTFMVFGATPLLTSVSTGAIVQSGRKLPFDSDNTTLAEGIARGGGLDNLRADPSAVFLFRYMPRVILENAGVDVSNFPAPMVPTVISVDLGAAEGYLLANQFYLKDRDIIFVADARSVDLIKVLTVLDAVTTSTRGVVGTASDIRPFQHSFR
jgi:polysaccharide biosynthesis/export protein